MTEQKELTLTETSQTQLEKARLIASSDLIPPVFQKKPANILILIELAQEIKVPLFTLMQNTQIIHGKLGFSSTFILALLKRTGEFKSLDYVFPKEDRSECALRGLKKDGTELIGPKVSLKMAEEEGWLRKTGSKWKTMPELMMRYRAISFFVRTLYPDILLGFYSVDELVDIGLQKEKKTIDSLKKGSDNGACPIDSTK